MNESVRMIIARQAEEWFVANREEALDARKSAAFSRWLKSSPLHVEEYLAITQLAGELQAARDPNMTAEDAIEQARHENSVLAAPAGFSMSGSEPRRRAQWFPFAAAIVILAGLSITYWKWEIRAPIAQHYVTTHGQQSTYRLPDNSILRLNTDTEIVVRYRVNERLVEITRGQAMFGVVHDSKRPFRVTAGSAEVRDLGTEFEVYRQTDVTRVTVVDGQVSVTPSKDAAGTHASAWNAHVSTGEQVQIVAGVLTSGPEPIDVGRSTAWLRRQIAFEQQPLSEVATEFNRYSPTPINIKTAALRGLKVSGVFAADDMESFIAFLRSLDGVSVELTPAGIDVRAL
jgi:transmembrane sensor